LLLAVVAVVRVMHARYECGNKKLARHHGTPENKYVLMTESPILILTGLVATDFSLVDFLRSREKANSGLAPPPPPIKTPNRRVKACFY